PVDARTLPSGEEEVSRAGDGTAATRDGTGTAAARDGTGTAAARDENGTAAARDGPGTALDGDGDAADHGDGTGRGDATPADAAIRAKSAGSDGAAGGRDALPEAELAAVADALEGNSIFGRVTPRQKQIFVTALQSRGHTVAMTGDGINDVLALIR